MPVAGTCNSLAYMMQSKANVADFLEEFR